MASGRKLVVRFGAVSSARFDLEADIGGCGAFGERFLCDVFDRDACRALLQLRRRTETRREGMFLAVELLARLSKLPLAVISVRPKPKSTLKPSSMAS